MSALNKIATLYPMDLDYLAVALENLNIFKEEYSIENNFWWVNNTKL